MRTYFVYISLKVVRGEEQRTVSTTQDWRQLDQSNRHEVPAIWRVKNCNSSEHAKGRVLMYQAFPGARINATGVTRIR